MRFFSLFLFSVMFLSLLMVGATTAALAGGSKATFKCETDNCPKGSYRNFALKCKYWPKGEGEGVLTCRYGSTPVLMPTAGACVAGGGDITFQPHRQMAGELSCK